MAGYDWLWSFLRRNPDISVRQAEGLSMARARGLFRVKVQQFYNILENEMKKYNLQDKPQNIFNMNESDIQLINKVGKVVISKGAKVVHKMTTGEKSETVTLICCCLAEGRFLPPTLVYKGKNLKAEFKDNLPRGSTVYTNEKSAYVNSELFMKWFKEEFLPRKAPGRKLSSIHG
ncbi:PREDICTED: uncharacterized protein LOC108766610 [Trachymyrmex cornetzi]|uniref:uncharacterized protein LOC108766610 n=1 Tax=Trachymyrmex cornetzi TaxID=471704 RepID=UPI00084F82D5|nr:PREDICTED: uncharacterized protein LOC108766610 [Trachymyrmex cornetzi]XP_018371514.1 PREDICTED: uncharacterized protein LOC108766610 [Trachymyrmex cornetzi]